MRREKPGALSHIADVPVGIENPRGTGLRPSARRRSLFLPPSSPPSLSPSCRFIYVQKCRHLAESVGSYEGERQRKRKRAREKQAARGRERESKRGQGEKSAKREREGRRNTSAGTRRKIVCAQGFQGVHPRVGPAPDTTLTPPFYGVVKYLSLSLPFSRTSSLYLSIL